MINFLKISENLTKQLSKKEKTDNGIFFTPPSIIETNLKLLESHFSNIKTILEPSFGSGEYLYAINKLYPKYIITGFELNKTIFDTSLIHFSDNNNLLNQDFLKYQSEEKYDLIIGNPPYFVLKKKEVDKYYNDYYEGRPNIFILFIIKSLQLLNPDGILSFVLPKSFLNCLYYDKTRKFIYDNYHILNIIDCSNASYLETQQETVIFIIQNKVNPDNNKFRVNNTNFTILGTPKNIIEINKLYKNSSYMKDLGLKVSVGNIVWNQISFKEELKDKNDKIIQEKQEDHLSCDSSQPRLIYTSDINNDNELYLSKFKEKVKDKLGKLIKNPKKHYINEEKFTKYCEGKNKEKIYNKEEIVLILNRGYGNGKYKLKYCLVDIDNDYYIENHLLVIDTSKKINKDEKKILYDKIIKSFKDKRTQDFIDLYFHNNAINLNELLNVLPIYQDI